MRIGVHALVLAWLSCSPAETTVASPLPPCSGGAFVLAEQPLLGALPVPDRVIVADGNLAIASGCPTVPATVRTGRTRTRLRARWETCRGHERVRLALRFRHEACGEVAGTLRAAGQRGRRFVASRQRCTQGENRFRCGRFLDIAHRGGALLRPENTLAAFAHAGSLGADVLEMDVQATADGDIVVLHDPTVDRTTDGVGAVAALSTAVVRTLDAGYRFTTDGGLTFPYRDQGIRVPLLAEVLAQHPDAFFSIEIKQYAPSIVDAVLAVIAAAGANERTVVVAFAQPTMDEVREKAPPGLLTGMTLAENATFTGLTDATEPGYVPPAPVAQLPFASVTPEVMARAERLGVILQAWTVDLPPTMDALLALGVHGIMSNDPELLRARIDAAGVDTGVGP